MVRASELDIDTVREGASAVDMAQYIFGSGVIVTGAIFPDINADTGTGYSPSARRILRRYEVEILRTAQAA